MKIKLYMYTYTRQKGDSFTMYSFSENEIVRTAKMDHDYHLTQSERMRVENAYVEGFEITVPDDYKLTVANTLDTDIRMQDIICPEFDESSGMYSQDAQILYIDLMKCNLKI